MKKLLSVLSSTLQGGLRGGLLILALLATTSLWAYDFQSGDLYYNITSSSAPYTVEVTNQKEWSSSNYSGLTTATIPGTVTYNGTTYSVTSIGEYAFYKCSSLTSVTIGNSVTSIGMQAFQGCSSLTSVTIPNSVTSIGDDAFWDCSSLTSVTIPNSVTSIGYYAFCDCFSLKSISIPNSVTSIGRGAFQGCSSLTSVTIPNSVTSIGRSAFDYCSSLTSITIPESVTSIGEYAFRGCSSLTSVTCEAETPPTVGSDAFNGVSTSIPVYVPCGCVSAYKRAYGWENFTNIQVPLAEYSIQVSTSNSQMGTAKVDYNTYCEGAHISALAYDRYHLVQWSDGNTDNPRNLILTQDTVLTAEFAINQYTVTTRPSHNERGTTQGDTTVNYLENITISATANYGYHFTQWNDGDTTNPRQVQVTENKTYTAQFDKNTYTITAQWDNEMGSVSAPETAQYLDQVTISATANHGYHFVQWSDGVTDNPRTLILTQDTTFTAEFAQTLFGQCGTNLYWELIETTLHITGSGTMYNYTSDTAPWKLLVSSINSLTIAEDVTSIDRSAFSNCPALESVVWNAKNYTNPTNKEAAPFYDICSQIKFFTFGDAVEYVPAYLCYGMEKLTSVTIPNSVTSIGDDAFYRCSALESIVWNAKNCADASSLQEAPFYELSSQIKSFTFGDAVEYVPAYLCYGMEKLTSVTIPNSVTSIGEYAFNGCSKLTKTNYTGDIAGWCNIMFGSNYANPMYCSHNFYINDQEIKDLVIPNNVTSIGSYAFNGCSSLTSVTIPNSVTSIGNYAFADCSSLTSVNIGESVKSIDYAAFRGCSSLTSIVVESGNTAYDSRNNCNAIIETATNTLIHGCQNTTIPNSVTSIGNYAFADCSSLTSVTIPNSVTNIGDHAFNSCSSLTSVTIPNSVTSIGASAFYNCSKLTKTNYTGDIAGWCNIEFGNYAANPMYCSHNFYINDQEIKDLVIPNSVTSIGSSAFYGCSSLTSVTIPNSVTSIEGSVFYGCSSLTSVNIGESVTSIGDDAFSGCSSLNSVNIGESVTSIGDDAFSGCSSLNSITCEAENPSTVGSDAFYRVSKSIPVYVPCGCVKAYKAKSGWKDFTNIQEPLAEYSIEVNVNDNIMGTAKVDYNTFCKGNQISAKPNFGYHFVQWSDGNTNNPRSLELTQDTILTAEFALTQFGQCGENLYWEQIETTLHITGSGEMYNYTSDTVPWKLLVSSIKSLTIAEDVTSIERSAFSGCTAIESIVWNAKNYANPANTEAAPFYDIRSQIKSFTFGDNVEHIPAYLCYGMDKLTSVTTPNKLNTIGTSAFEGCARLAKISFGTGLEEIAANAFAGCTRLYDIYVYVTYPPFAEESSFANYNVYVYIPCEYQRDYILDIVWGKFKFIECIESEETTTDGVIITPSTNDVTITWPTETGADSYTIVIKKGDTVFCTLTFNADGQLLNIAFAPGRDGNRPAQYAEQAGNGYRFTVTGLEEGTQYAYSVTTKDAANQTIATYSGEFTTMGGTTTDMDNIQSPMSNCQKLLRNGQLLILRDGKTYTIMGQEI